jgi:hypothetical protein
MRHLDQAPARWRGAASGVRYFGLEQRRTLLGDPCTADSLVGEVDDLLSVLP